MMLFIIEPDDRRERHILDAGVLGVVLARVPLPQDLRRGTYEPLASLR